MRRVRIGILLIILSWLPIAQVTIYIAHQHHHLTSNDASDSFRFAVWGVQFIIGFIGLWLVGKVAMATARASGIKRLPGNIWHLFWEGERSDR
jgi:hypothetical protein